MKISMRNMVAAQSEEMRIAKEFAIAVGRTDGSLRGKKITYSKGQHKVFAINHGSWKYNNPAIDKLCDRFESKYRGYYFTTQGGGGSSSISVSVP